MTTIRLYAALAAAAALLAAGCSATQTAEERELANTFKEHANDKPVASPMAYTKPAKPVTGEPVAYAVANEQDITGWLNRLSTKANCMA